MAGSFKGGMQPPYNDPPPTYEESQKHPKVQDGPMTYQQMSHYPPRFSRQSQGSPYPQQESATSLPQGYQLPYQHPVCPQTGSQGKQQVVITDAYDPGVRFGREAPPSIPPPPPGVAPNAAQMAAQKGAQVVTSVKKSSFW